MSSSAASSIMLCFVLVALLAVGLGLFAMWAEFKSKGKEFEYTRYKHDPIAESSLFPSWHVKSEESLPHWAYGYTAHQY